MIVADQTRVLLVDGEGTSALRCAGFSENPRYLVMLRNLAAEDQAFQPPEELI
jgi:hypothetical protein